MEGIVIEASILFPNIRRIERDTNNLLLYHRVRARLCCQIGDNDVGALVYAYCN